MAIGIFGDAFTLEYNFQTKVANSMAECPMKIYGQDVTLASLSSPTTGWTENTTQSELNLIKHQDGNALSKSTSVSGKARAMLVELDLSALVGVGKLFADNTSLKSALKNIAVDVWALGSGANGGTTTNGVKVLWWDGTGWADYGIVNNTSSIAKMSYSPTSGTETTNKIDSNNKFYLLIHSLYASNGTIASTVVLDYLNIRISLSKQPDIVSPITTKIPQYRSMLLRGFSPSYSESTADKVKVLWHLHKDDNNYTELNFDNSTKKFNYVKCISGTIVTLSSNEQTFGVFQIYHIECSQTSNGMVMRLMKNNSTIEKYTNNDISSFSGMGQLYPLTKNVTGNEADGFIEFISLIDLSNIPTGLDDTRISDIFKGTETEYENPELVQNGNFASSSNWTLHSQAIIENNMLTLNANDLFQSSYQDVNVFPNNLYVLNVTASTEAETKIEFYYNNIKLDAQPTATYGTGTLYFVTPNYCNKVRINLTNYSTGTYTFSNVSLKRFDDVKPVDNSVFKIDGIFVRPIGEELVVSRNSTEPNPLQMYCPTTITTFTANKLVNIQYTVDA